jgi:hypothetical protein
MYWLMSIPVNYSSRQMIVVIIQPVLVGVRLDVKGTIAGERFI